MVKSSIKKNRRKFIVSICGASGSIYGVRLLEELARRPLIIYVIISEAGKQVMAHETEYSGGPIDSFLKKRGAIFHDKAIINEYHKDNLFAPPASGSFQHHGMVIAPCSMNTVGAISSGIADDLIRRAADVTIKEKRRLILLTRETPLSTIHMENLLRLTRAGATIFPACPGFYNRPESVGDLVNSVVARVMDHLDVDHDLVKPWGEEGAPVVHV
jgi:4-hydroxy-3-polyprenylbenzoate decarboxylase